MYGTERLRTHYNNYWRTLPSVVTFLCKTLQIFYCSFTSESYGANALPAIITGVVHALIS